MGMPLSIKESDFIDCIDLTNLTDIQSSGTYYTWSNKRVVSYLAKKLGRVMRNDKWLDSFTNVAVDFTPPDLSDHCAGVLKFVQASQWKSSLKFFNFLTKHRDFLRVVKDHWLSTSVYGTQMHQLCAKLKALKAPLRTLNHKSYGGIQQRVIAARELLPNLKNEVLTHPTEDLIKAVHL